jgi:ferredoxin-type protein NapG
MSSGIGNFLRRIFIHGDNPLTKTYRENCLRPPGAVDEERFMALCIRCNRCLEVCPYGSIKRAGLGVTIGTPYVLPETKACYLCMACSRLCPTEALDTRLRNPEKVRMGKARIDSSICYSRLFLEHDVLPDSSGRKIGALCNTCYNVCPFPDKAIALENNLFPVVLDGCVGCGICVERCPTRPKRAINITPTGMGRVDEAGFYFRKARRHYEVSGTVRKPDPSKALKGQELMDTKQRIDGSRDLPKFKSIGPVEDDLDDWQ